MTRSPGASGALLTNARPSRVVAAFAARGRSIETARHARARASQRGDFCAQALRVPAAGRDAEEAPQHLVLLTGCDVRASNPRRSRSRRPPSPTAAAVGLDDAIELPISAALGQQRARSDASSWRRVARALAHFVTLRRRLAVPLTTRHAVSAMTTSARTRHDDVRQPRQRAVEDGELPLQVAQRRRSARAPCRSRRRGSRACPR